MKRLCMKEEKRINFSCLKPWVTRQATDQTKFSDKQSTCRRVEAFKMYNLWDFHKSG